MKKYFFCYAAKDSCGNTQMGNFEAETDQLTWEALCLIVKAYCDKKEKEGIFMCPKNFSITFFHELDR